MSYIEYQGSVTIVKKLNEKYIGTKHYHNNGTRWLFDYLCKYLWDGEVDDRGVPFYLDIIGVDGDGKSKGSLLTAPVYTYQAEGIRQVATESQYPYIQKKFYLGYNNFKSTPGFSGASLYMVLLHSSGDTNYLATIPLVDEDKNPLTTYDIKEGESHEIYWKMEFVNPAEQQISPDNKL